MSKTIETTKICFMIVLENKSLEKIKKFRVYGTDKKDAEVNYKQKVSSEWLSKDIDVSIVEIEGGRV